MGDFSYKNWDYVFILATKSNTYYIFYFLLNITVFSQLTIEVFTDVYQKLFAKIQQKC